MVDISILPTSISHCLTCASAWIARESWHKLTCKSARCEVFTWQFQYRNVCQFCLLVHIPMDDLPSGAFMLLELSYTSRLPQVLGSLMSSLQNQLKTSSMVGKLSVAANGSPFHREFKGKSMKIHTQMLLSSLPPNHWIVL